MRLTEHTMAVAPWSDSYWPLYLGVLAFRYGDAAYPLSFDFRVNNAYMLKNLGRAADIGDISPAEKYDLLIGSKNFEFTRRMLNKGKQNIGSDGMVPKWLGICHGWAPASMSVPRPTKVVHVRVADGRIIPFYPSDIKALITLLWAKAETKQVFAGGRCYEQVIRRGASGRAINPDCQDSNPATWHLAVVNQFGFDKKSFVMDTYANKEVWNYVVTSYRYNYFNPITSQSTTVLSDAKVPIADFTNDRFKKFRAKGTHSVVGIEMDITYKDEAPPVKQQFDNETFDLVVAKKFRYDLELDVNGKIIGGEWHSDIYPDFLWQMADKKWPLAHGDQLLVKEGDTATWNEGELLPASWARAARQSVAKEQPLAKIVEALIVLSNKEVQR